jgi:hypothetical protein
MVKPKDIQSIAFGEDLRRLYHYMIHRRGQDDKQDEYFNAARYCLKFIKQQTSRVGWRMTLLDVSSLVSSPGY